MDRWEYLVSKEYKLRHHICKYFLTDMDLTIDVGAYKYTIEDLNIIPIDPLKSMGDSYHGTVYEWYKEYADMLNENFGVMALGLEIEGDKNEWNCFFDLIERSKIAIIEHSIEHEPSVIQFNKIINSTTKELVAIVEFEFRNVDTPGFVPHSKRKLVILERK
jgi:hypothetical protein